MANISDATGIISFSPTFFKDHFEIICNWLRNAITDGDYGITNIGNDFDVDDSTELPSDFPNLTFSASGRWSWNNSLKENGLGLTQSLMKCMYDSGEVIKISFTDYEPSDGAFYSEKGEVSVSEKSIEPFGDKYKEVYKVLEDVTLPMDAKTLYELGFEEGYDISNPSDFDVVKDAFDELNFSEEQQTKLFEIIEAKEGNIVLEKNIDYEEHFLDLLEECPF